MRLEEAQAIVARVSYHGMKFDFGPLDHENMGAWSDRIFLFIRHQVLDSETLVKTDIITRCTITRTWFEMAIKDEDEFIGWIWRQVQKRVLHEAGEFFRVDGQRPHDPHRHERQPPPH